MKFGETKYGETDANKEEVTARQRYDSILDKAIEPTTIYVSYNEELQSYIMWYATMDKLTIKRTKGESYAI